MAAYIKEHGYRAQWTAPNRKVMINMGLTRFRAHVDLPRHWWSLVSRVFRQKEDSDAPRMGYLHARPGHRREDAFDLGGLVSAIIGVMILLGAYRIWAGRRAAT